MRHFVYYNKVRVCVCVYIFVYIFKIYFAIKTLKCPMTFMLKLSYRKRCSEGKRELLALDCNIWSGCKIDFSAEFRL